MRQSHLAKVAMVLLPALFIAVVAIFITDMREVVFLLTASVLIGLTAIAAYVVRSNSRLQAKQDSISAYLIDSRAKQSKKEFEILNELSSQRQTLSRFFDSQKHKSETDARKFKELDERLADMHEFITFSNERIARDFSSAYSVDEETKRNRSAVQDLFTRMLNGQNDIFKRLTSLEARVLRRDNDTNGEPLD